MRRQGTLRSSSSGREAAAASSGDRQSATTVRHAANSVGCMAGVFQLISSKYRTRRRFLTFGRKQQQKQTTVSASSSSSPQQSKNAAREVPRSPTIPQEIRRSSSSNSPEGVRSPVPSIVARLMGLEDAPAPQPPPAKPDSASEKRRKLLGALEKCDEDLQALKRIIEAVRTTDRSKTPSPPLVSVGRGDGVVATKKCTDPMSYIAEQEQPSPVSVLEDFCESPPPPPSTGGYSFKHTKNDMCRLGRVTPQQQQRKKPREVDNVEIATFCFHNNRMQVPRPPFFPLSPPRSSGGSMSTAVDEVCKDVEMGQRREVERVGVVIEDFIYRDLIEEMTKCLMGPRHVAPRLPYDKCKRKLRF